jgi:hypothetical protein
MQVAFFQGGKMPYALFHNLFPEVAKRETRTVIVMHRLHFALPPAQYSFLEMFCDEPGCDCRRVLFSVMSSRHEDVQAVIGWGWEDKEYYAKWMGRNDPAIIEEMKGPALNLASPQSNLAPGLLELFRNVLLQDTGYLERVKRHYAMFREEIDSKHKPAVPRKKGGKRKKKR